MNIKIISIVITLICISSIIECKKTLMCWYRQSAFPTLDYYYKISELCTHLILVDYYAFNYNDDIDSQLKSLDSVLDYLEPKDLIKIENSSIKILFSYNISRIYESEEMMKNFATFLVAAIKKSDFDGVELTGAGPSYSDEALNYIIMLQELNKLIKKDGSLLVHRISGNKNKINNFFKLAEMEPYLDYFVLETFRFHTYLDGKIGVSAPLNYSDGLSVVSAVDNAIKLGIPRNKLLLGFATYGVTFLANNIDYRNFIGMPSTSPVTNLPFPRDTLLDDDIIEYNKICQLIYPGSRWTNHWHSLSSTPYLTIGRKFITYDDGRSYLAKLKYLKDQKLGGAALFTLNYDDIGPCSSTMFFLTTIVRREFDKEEEEKSEDITQEEDEEPIIPVKIKSITIINIMY